MTVLVAFATGSGSTRAIAERIASRLEQAGVPARARPVNDELDLRGYSAAIIGSAIHNGHWLPEASDWAKTHARSLAAMPVWLFSVSSVGDEESAFPPKLSALMRRARKETAESKALRQLLRANEHRNFAGVVDGEHWSGAGRLFMKIVRGRLGDHRNWPAIDAWSERIAAQLRSIPDTTS